MSVLRGGIVLTALSALSVVINGWAAAPLKPLSTAVDSSVHEKLAPTVVGWHWYNEPPKEKKADKSLADEAAEKTGKPHPIKKAKTVSAQAWIAQFHQLPPLQQLKLLQAVTTERRVKAVLSGRVEDIAAYKAAQDFWVRRATAFTVGWEQMLLRYPHLDYSLTYSHQNFLAPLMQQARHRQEHRAIDALQKNNGLVFFYRGAAPEDRLFSGIVHRFSQKYRFSVIAVSVDGKTSADFPNSRFDLTQRKATAMGVGFVPALVLVNPIEQRAQVVSYGAQSEADLSVRFWRLANHWQPGF